VLDIALRVLALRLVVLVAVSGGIGLTLIALGAPDGFRLGALGIYGILVVVPVIWLAAK
jgi:hypothetical protein